MATKTSHRRRSERELRAIGFQLADEIETVAQRFVLAGHPRDVALRSAIAQIAGV